MTPISIIPFYRSVSVFGFLGFLSLYQICSAATMPPDRAQGSLPKVHFLRYQEDWSVLKGIPSAQLSRHDRIKFIALNSQGSNWLSLGGHLRVRAENWSNFAFSAPQNDNDSFLLWRMTGHADLHVGRHYRVFLEGKSALATDRDLPGRKRTLDVDTYALQQAFWDVRFSIADNTTLTIRPGRQELLLGKQRLVSPLPWGNSLRSWDGVSLLIKSKNWRTHGFWTQFVPVVKYGFNDADQDNLLFGLYSSRSMAHTAVDLYWLGIDRKQAGFNGSSGSELRHTLGSHISGQSTILDGMDYDVEVAYQFGHVGRADIQAYMFASEIGHIHPWKGRPRLALGLDYASGDHTFGGDVQTFNQLFPLGHAYLGYIDLIGRQNIIDFSQHLSIKLYPKTTLRADSHVFWRPNRQDALYNPGGKTVRTGSPNSARFAGNEIDLTLKHTLIQNLNGNLGYSHYFPGDFIQQTGADQDIDFVYAQAIYIF